MIRSKQAPVAHRGKELLTGFDIQSLTAFLIRTLCRTNFLPIYALKQSSYFLKKPKQAYCGVSCLNLPFRTRKRAAPHRSRRQSGRLATDRVAAHMAPEAPDWPQSADVLLRQLTSLGPRSQTSARRRATADFQLTVCAICASPHRPSRSLAIGRRSRNRHRRFKKILNSRQTERTASSLTTPSGYDLQHASHCKYIHHLVMQILWCHIRADY